ncbi:MAG: hypothetical protein AAGG07_06670 [Planctomycetota bacterium]
MTKSQVIEQKPPGAGLDERIRAVGGALHASLSAALDALEDRPQGPQALATRLKVDKVLASRLLKALRSPDPMLVVHRAPGPDPLRRVLKALSGQGVTGETLDAARDAVDRFASLIRDDLGDRGGLNSIVAAWVPEARRDLEQRQKQAAFKAISQLKGIEARAIMATAVLHPSDDGARLDVVWLNALFGLRRLRPGARAKLVTRRMAQGDSRRPTTLDGEPINGFVDTLLAGFGTSKEHEFVVEQSGDVVHYTLADTGYGPGSERDVVLAEVNRAEMSRTVPEGSGRKGFLFAEASLPVESLQFDVIVHRDVYEGSDPSLRLYDTSFDGVADVNNRERDIDQLELLETIESFGTGVERLGSSVIPGYAHLLGDAFARLGWDRANFRAYRCEIDYPLYGSQVAMCFDPPRR